ncbi:MAG: tRNA1(Val) (adenine(37)-N6)-methyltransferase [Oscillospiraceae bacterium]
MAEMAARSVAMNGLSERMRILQGDLRHTEGLLAPCSFDVAVMNPPYSPMGSGPVSQRDAHALSRHEAACTAGDMARAAFRLLRNGGRLSVIYPAERIYEVMEACLQARMTPKRLRLVQHSQGRPPKLLLMEAVRQGKPGIAWMAPLILCEPDGSYTAEARRIYHQE